MRLRAAAGRLVPVLLLLAGCRATEGAGPPPSAARAASEGVPLARECASASMAPDTDADGLSDACEHALAAAFAPELRVDPGDCAWDPQAVPARLGGGYLYAAQRVADGRAVRIAYLPAYHRDCGWRGPQCVLTPGACRPHDGDSEAIVVEVEPAEGSRWRTVGIFLSAHCHGRSDGRCRWYRDGELRRFAWAEGRPRGAPVVWMARGKHGNYPTRAACETGHWLYDTCQGNRAAYRFPVVSPAQNVGSRHRPGGPRGDGCLRADELPWPTPAAAPGAVECFWRADAPFRGWQQGAAGDAPSPYERYLRERAGF